MGVVVQTVQGRVDGIEHGKHQSFLGIPYARPPVGELRFRAPEPAESWSGVRDASEFAASAPQAASATPGMAASGPQDEDCLYLNVYTPSADGGVRPVLFWIHGGGFTLGSGSEPLYDGGPLAERGDVVVVTIHYRLGALGYLYLGGHDGDAWGATANAGQLDQVLALTWVRDNIAAFGGDPLNVTIFGQSAGASAVASLLAMPAAKGLFHRAILESGSGARLAGEAAGSRLAGALLEELGLESADAGVLQGVSVEAIIEAQGAAAAKLRGAADGASFGPVVDGKTLPRPPHDIVRDGGASAIPIIVGSNRDEMKQFNAMDRNRSPIDDGPLADLVRGMLADDSAGRAPGLIDSYRTSRSARQLPDANTDILDAIQTDLRFRVPGIRLAEAQRPHQPNTYCYLFTWESPARRGALGACHSLEMPFVFGTLDAPTQDRFAGTGPDVERLSANMMGAWIAFARSGDPAHEGIGRWAPYDAERRRTMVFGRTSELVDAPFDNERAAWHEIVT